MKTAKPFGLRHSKINNWLDEKAVCAFVLNPEASMHERLSYCWSVVDGLQDIGIALLGDGDEGNDFAMVASIFLRELGPLAELLEHMADELYVWPEPKKGGGEGATSNG